MARVWVVTDGRAGNLAQGLGLAEALGRLRPVAIERHDVTPRPWAARMPPRLWQALGARDGGWPFSGLRGPRPGPPWPALIVGAGRRAAPIVAAIRRLHGVAAVQVLDPRMAWSAFDHVVVPQHDGRGGPGGLVTLGALGRITADAVALAAREVAAPPPPTLAVLVGGPSRSARWEEADTDRLVAALADLAAGMSLMVTPSRRTPPGVVARLVAALPPGAVWDRAGPNPYPGALGHAEAVLVTADSVNMASEAACTGLPVHVFGLGGLAPKLARFHAGLAAHGAARPFAGRIEHWRYPPLAEADRIAALIAPLLSRGG